MNHKLKFKSMFTFGLTVCALCLLFILPLRAQQQQQPTNVGAPSVSPPPKIPTKARVNATARPERKTAANTASITAASPITALKEWDFWFGAWEDFHLKKLSSGDIIELNEGQDLSIPPDQVLIVLKSQPWVTSWKEIKVNTESKDNQHGPTQFFVLKADLLRYGIEFSKAVDRGKHAEVYVLSGDDIARTISAPRNKNVLAFTWHSDNGGAAPAESWTTAGHEYRAVVCSDLQSFDISIDQREGCYGWARFRKASGPAGSFGENLQPGTCGWVDREMSASEPRVFRNVTSSCGILFDIDPSGGGLLHPRISGQGLEGLLRLNHKSWIGVRTDWPEYGFFEYTKTGNVIYPLTFDRR